MANNYNVTPQEAQELEEKKRREEESKAKANAQKAVASVKGVTGDVVANWAKPKEEPKSYPYKQQEQSSTSIWQPNQIEMPTLKSVEDAYANRKFSADNIRTEGAKRRKSNIGSTTKERAKALEKKFPEYKNLTSFGIKTPEQYLNTGGDENKYADYVFDIVSKKHNDYFDSIDTSNAETVSGDMYAKEYGDAYNEALKMRNKAKYYRAETFDRNRQQAVNMWGLPDVTKADGFYNRGTQHVAPSVAKTSLENYSKGGNVDLTDRNVFDGSNIKQFGWDVKDGEAVTTLTNTYTNKDGSVAMNFTPIGKRADGSYFVLTPDELTQYAEAVAEGTREDDLGLKIGKTFEGANAVKKATEEADRIHTLQEDYYLNGQLNSELNKLDAMTAEHNKGYPWKDTFDYTLDKYVPEQKQEADEKKVNSLADQSRKIAFLFEEQKKTAPASQSADYDKVIKQFKGQADAYDNLSTTLEDYMVNQSYYGYDEKSFNDFKKLESEIRDTVLKNYENPEGLSDKAFASIKNTDGVLANGDMPFDLSAELLTEDAYNKTAMSKNKSYNEYLFEEGYRRLEAINNTIETYNVYYTENPKTQEDKNRNALYEKLEGARYDVSERMREIADYIDTDARIKAGSAEGMTIDQWNKLEDKPYKTYNEYLYYLGEDKGSAQKRDDMYTAISKVGVLRHDTRFASLSKDEQDKLTSQRNSLTARARGVAEILNSFEEAEKNTNASYKESFGGSFDANYALGWLNDEVSDAWNTYYETGDAEALRGAKAMSKVQEDFVAKHSKALEHDSGWAANLISHSLASYLPQKLSQLESAAPLMLALAPFALPSLALGATTIGGATKLGTAANKAGFIYGNLGTAEAAGSFTYNYRQMRGAAMEALTEEGLSYEDAKPLAHSEALLSSGVELASEVFSVVTLATGKIPGVSKLKDFMGDGIKGVVAGAGDDMLSALGVPQKAASAIKGVVRFGGSYLTSAATEGVEEYIQTDISSANKRIARQIKNAVNGGDVSGLIAETYNVLFRPTKEERAEANESAWEGFKTGLVADGGTGIVIRLANKVDSTIADHRDNIEIGKDIVKNDEQMVTLINAIKFGNKATNKYAEKLVKGLYNGNDVNEAQYGKLAKMTAESYEEAMQNASEYTSPAVPTSSSYTENKGLNDVLNGLNIKAVDEIVSDANLMNEFAKVSGVNLYSPVNNPKVNGAVKTVANGGDLNSKAINDILNDSNAMNELEEASGVALTRTSDTSIRQSIRDAVGVLAEESPRLAVAQYATTKALARGAVALQSIGYTKTDAENIMSRYAGEQNPEEVAKLMKAVSMLERDIYTNPEYGLGRFASAKKSAEVIGTAVNLMTNPEAVITRHTLEGFAKAFTDSAKQTNSIGYKNIVSALKEYGFEGNDAEVRQLLYNAVYEGKAEYRGKDFSDNRFVSAFADNLKLFTNSTLAFASSNNPNLTPANMQTVIAINKNNWSDVLQITEDSGIIDSKGSDNNGRKILRQAQKRSSSRTDSGTVERVRKEQGQGSDTGRGSRAEEEKRRSKSSSDGRVRQDSERRRLTVGSYEVNFSDGVALNSDDQDIQSYLEARGFTANAITDITLANGTQLEGFTTGKNVYYDANGDKWQITGHELVHALKRVDRNGYEALKNRIIKGLGKKNFNKLVEAYEELYGTVYNKANTSDIVEEIICDVAGNALANIGSIKDYAITNDMVGAVNEYFDSAVTDELVEGESGLVSEELKAKYVSDADRLYGVHWTLDYGILDEQELAPFYSDVALTLQRKSRKPITSAGEYVFDFDNKLIFYKGTYYTPVITRVIELNEMFYEDDVQEIWRLIYETEKGSKSSNKKQNEIIENLFGQALIFEYNIRDYVSDWEDRIREGEGEYGSGDYQTNGKFKLKSPVEESKNLIAQHNLGAEDLLGSFDLGGFPAPSIAIIKAEQGHTKFGEYSLLFDKSTIDPKADRYNYVFSGDAYTPTFPSVDYKPNSKVIERINKLYYSLGKKYGYDDIRALYAFSDSDNAKDKLQSAKGETELIRDLKDNPDMMKVFLLDTQGKTVEPIETETVTELREYDVMRYDYLIEKLGKEFFENIQTPPGAVPLTHRKEYLSAHKDELESAYKDMYRELMGFSDNEIDNIIDNTNASTYMNLMRDVLNYIRNGKTKVTRSIDTTATNEAIRKEAKESGYDNWVDDLFEGIEETKGIRNKKDPFTPSGNRRSFEDLHWEYNLENIVEAMRAEDSKGISIFGGSVLGAAHKEYKNIDQIKADQSRLQHMDEEEYNAMRKDFISRFGTIADRFAQSTDWQKTDGARELLIESLVKNKTADRIKSYLKREADGFYHYTDALGDEFIQFVNEIAQMPTGYFEAKPMRVVNFDEIRMAVIPDNAPDKIIEGLEDNNILCFRDIGCHFIG